MAAELADALYRPRSVAIVGGSRDESKLAGRPLRNLRRAGFDGTIHVVNPSGGEQAGAEVVRSVDELPRSIDLAISLVPAAAAVDVVRSLAAQGTRAVVVAASGFSEHGHDGRQLEQALTAAVAGTDTRLVGPNCNGLYSVAGRLPLGYNRAHGWDLLAGNIAVLSQSGAMLGTLVDGIERCGGNMHHLVSTGNEADLGVCDLLELALDEPDVDVVVLVIDRVGDGRRFRRLCERARAEGTHVVVLKFGNTVAGQRASRSHSARMAGDERVYERVLTQAGARHCRSIPELTATAALLGRGVEHRDGVLAFSTSGAGGAMLADAVDEAGVELAELDPAAEQRLVETLRFVQPNNPIDLGAGSSRNAAENFAALTESARGRLGILLLTPPPTPEAASVYVDSYADFAASIDGAALAVVSDQVDASIVRRWEASGVPVLSTPADAARVAAHLCRPTTPAAGLPSTDDARVVAEVDATRILRDRGVPFPRSEYARHTDDVVDAGRRIGFPLVLKADVAGLDHKAALGLVHTSVTSVERLRTCAEGVASRTAELRLDLRGYLVVEQVEDGVDLIVSARRDREFGSIGIVGLGGTAAESLDRFEVMLDADPETVAAALHTTGVESVTAPIADAVAALLQRCIDLLGECPELETVELNPVRLHRAEASLLALDALLIRGDRT